MIKIGQKLSLQNIFRPTLEITAAIYCTKMYGNIFITLILGHFGCWLINWLRFKIYYSCSGLMFHASSFEYVKRNCKRTLLYFKFHECSNNWLPTLVTLLWTQCTWRSRFFKHSYLIVLSQNLSDRILGSFNCSRIRRLAFLEQIISLPWRHFFLFFFDNWDESRCRFADWHRPMKNTELAF